MKYITSTNKEYENFHFRPYKYFRHKNYCRLGADVLPFSYWSVKDLRSGCAQCTTRDRIVKRNRISKFGDCGRQMKAVIAMGIVHLNIVILIYPHFVHQLRRIL